MKAKLAIGVLVAILATASTPGHAQQPVQQPPTATELFNLRSTCAQLGQKLLDKIDPQPQAPPIETTQISRYDTTTGHCYVEIDARHTDDNGYFVRSLFDGKTGKFIAQARKENGSVEGITPRNTDAGPGKNYEEANAYINGKMSENHQ
jgi:hypothetical protein